MTANRKSSLMLVIASYIAAAIAGAAVFALTPGLSALWRIAAADIAATLVIWALSLIARNASLYDPYWSVAPAVLFVSYTLHIGKLGAPSLLLLLLLLLWGVRLTANWARNFPNLKSQDWRYTNFEREYKRLWPLINLFGIQLMPTIVVFLAMLPAFYVAWAPSRPYILTVPAILIAIAAVYLEHTADIQMHRFRSDSGNKGCVNTSGLWRHIRHPNYLGEIMFWWGIFLTSLSMASLPVALLAGPLVVTALFLFVSIPMMEKRQIGTKPDYRAYQRTTGMLLPRFRHRDEENKPAEGK